MQDTKNGTANGTSLLNPVQKNRQVAAEYGVSDAATLSESQWQLVSDQFCKGASTEEFNFFRAVVTQWGLDPFKGHANLIARWDTSLQREVRKVELTIHGYRAISDKHPEYMGVSQPMWYDAEENRWLDIWTKNYYPAAAKVAVFRRGRKPTVGKVHWDEYVGLKKAGGVQKMWDTKPALMLAKCAEAEAHRKAFPNVYGQTYIPEEMMQAENPDSTQQPAPAEKTQQSTPADKSQLEEITSLLETLLPIDPELHSRFTDRLGKTTPTREQASKSIFVLRTRIQEHTEKEGVVFEEIPNPPAEPAKPTKTAEPEPVPEQAPPRYESFITMIQAARTLPILEKTWKSLPKAIQLDPDVKAACFERKAEIQLEMQDPDFDVRQTATELSASTTSLRDHILAIEDGDYFRRFAAHISAEQRTVSMIKIALEKKSNEFGIEI